MDCSLRKQKQIAFVSLLALLVLVFVPHTAWCGDDETPKDPDGLFEVEVIEENENECDTIIRFRTSRDGRIRLMDNSVSDMVRVGRSMEIPGDMRVDGDAVVVGGNLDIRGEVNGDAVVVGGVLTLFPGSEVDGDVVVVGGSMNKMPGAFVTGEQVNIGYGFEKFFPWSYHKTHVNPVHRAFKTLAKYFAVFIFMFLLILIFIDLLEKPTRRIANTIQEDYFRTGLAGILGFVLTPVTFLVLVISIVGIILTPVLFVLLLVASGWGVIAVSLVTGRTLGVKIFPGLVTPRWQAVIGYIMITVVTLSGKLLLGFGGPFTYLGWTILIAGKVIFFLAFLIGFGAVLMSRFGRRGKEEITDESAVPHEEPLMTEPKMPIDPAE